MRIRFDLDSQATDALVASAMKELRPPNLQAQVLLRRSLGLPVPIDLPEKSQITPKQATPVP
jgi:hypothetical protein